MKKVNFRVKRIVLDEPARRFLQSLKALREEAGLTKQALAKAIGITSSCITTYENGEHTPLLEILIKLAEFFSYDLSESMNYKLYYGEISPVQMRYQLKRYGLSYSELSRMVGYSPYSVRNCFIFSKRVTPQCLHAVLKVLEEEQQAYNLRLSLMRKGIKLKHED